MTTDLNVALVVRATDNASPAISRISRGLQALGNAARQLTGNAGFGRLGQITKSFADRLGPLAAQLSAFRSALTRAITPSAILGATGLGAALGTIGAAAITTAIATRRFAGDVIRTSAKFEDFAAVLRITEGSAEKASQSLDWVSSFAAKTPYELAEVTDAFVRLRSYGMDPTNGLLQTLGDTASAMNKPLLQAAEAMADAITGENERLKEFGIKAKKSGDEITYEYSEGAKTLTKTVDASNRAMIASTLAAIFNAKYKGAMEERSKTWNGMLSNLADSWTHFQRRVGDAGLFAAVKGVLSDILKYVNALDASGALKRIATSIGEPLAEMFRAAWGWVQKWIEAQGGIEVLANRLGATIRGVRDLLFGVGEGIDPLPRQIRAIVDGTDDFTAAMAGASGGMAVLFGQRQDIDRVRRQIGDATAGLATFGSGASVAASQTTNAFASVIETFDAIAKSIRYVSSTFSQLADFNERSKSWGITRAINNLAGGKLPWSKAEAPAATSAPRAFGMTAIPQASPAMTPARPAAAGQTSRSEVTVRFRDAPPGTRIESGRTSPGTALDVDLGYSGVGQRGR